MTYEPTHLVGQPWLAPNRSFCVVLFNDQPLFYDLSEHFVEVVKTQSFIKSCVELNATRAAPYEIGQVLSQVQISEMKTKQLHELRLLMHSLGLPPLKHRSEWERTELKAWYMRLFNAPEFCWQPQQC